MEYILYILYALAFWVLLYYTIKAAIRNAIIETRPIQFVEPSLADQPFNSQQNVLKEKYEAGEISWDEYVKRFNEAR